MHNFARLTSKSWIILCFSALIGSLSASPNAARAQAATQLGNGFELVPVVSGLNLGVGFAFLPQGHLLIAEKSGVVRRFAEGRLAATPFVDLSAEVNNFADRGLLGIAVHPQFPDQPYVYLLYTYDPPETAGQLGASGPDQGGARVARLVRLEADASQNYAVARTGSAQVLLGTASVWANIPNPAARNSYTPPACGARGAYVRDCLPADEYSHTIGTVAFGPDGALYVGNGDGCDYTAAREACTRALDLDSLAGKILRIDPLTGDALPSNPFFDGDARSNRSKVYQFGLRNPFRFSFDAQTGALFVGDVGWNTWEEINRAGPGANFGWPCYEGGNGKLLEQPQYANFARCAQLRASGETVTPSIYAYSHEGGGSSVQVGDVYRGTSYPESYRGALFYSDYNRMQIRYLRFDAQGQVVTSQVLAENISGLTQISADPQSGDLFLMRINFSAGAPTSSLSRLRYAGGLSGPLPPDVYTLRNQANDACVEALSGTTFLGLFELEPARLETRACATKQAQRFRLDEVAAGLYRVTSQSLAQVMARSGDQVRLASWANRADQRFRLSASGSGYRLVNEASGACLEAQGTSASVRLNLAPCSSAAAQIFRFLPEGNRPPLLVAPPAEEQASAGELFELQVAASDPDGDTLTYFASGLPPELSIDPETGLIRGVLAQQGEFEVELRVTDGYHVVSTSFLLVVDDDRLPVVTMIRPEPATLFVPFDVVRFEGDATDWQGEPLADAALSWSLYTHHNEHVHFDGLPPTFGRSGQFVAEDHGDGTWLELCLQATDTAGRSARVCRQLRPREVEYRIESVPSGLAIPWEGTARIAPFTVRTHVGGERSLDAPLTQQGFEFVSWSDGGAASHMITIASTPQTLVATYRRVAPVPGTYALRASHSEACLAYEPASYFLFWQLTPERFAQRACAPSQAQSLAVSENGDGTFRLVNALDQRALTVADDSTQPNALLVPQGYRASSSQHFRVRPQGALWTLENVRSGLCVEVQNASTAAGASYVQAPCAQRASQLFSLLPR